MSERNIERGMPSFGEGEEKEKSKEPVPVTGEELVGAFESKDFQKLLKESGKFMQETNRESSFHIVRDLYNSSLRFSSDVIEGEYGRMDPITAEEETHKKGKLSALDKAADILDLDEFINFTPVYLIEFHMHPKKFKEEPIIPSKDDLVVLNMIKSIDSKAAEARKSVSGTKIWFPLGVIGQFDEKGNYKLLLFQEQFKHILEDFPASLKVLDEELEELSESWNKQSQEEALRLLRENRYKAEIIKITKDGEISKEDKEKIKKFVSKPISNQ
jgi:hypothetical protein